MDNHYSWTQAQQLTLQRAKAAGLLAWIPEAERVTPEVTVRNFCIAASVCDYVTGRCDSRSWAGQPERVKEALARARHANLSADPSAHPGIDAACLWLEAHPAATNAYAVMVELGYARCQGEWV